MERPKWPKLRHTNPADLKEHALSLGGDFKAIQKFLKAGVSDVAPSLPKGIEHKIKAGIARGLVEVESREYSNTCVFVHDRDLISNTIFEEVNAKTAAAFHNRVPQYLFQILQESYDELCIKLVHQQNVASQPEARMAGSAFGSAAIPETPPQSPQEETDSAISIGYGSDTEALIHHDWVEDKNRLSARVSKLKAQLQVVERERNAVSQRLREKASKIKSEIREVELEDQAADRRESACIKAMEVRRLEQDRTGNYGTKAVGYNVSESADGFLAKREITARYVTLGIHNQAVVNRLFNMSASILMRKVKDAVRGKPKSAEDRKSPSITHFLGAELLDDGNIRLWSNSTDEYVSCENDAFDNLEKMPSWDQAIFANFAGHLTEPHESYPVEVKDLAVEGIDLRDRKQKASVITDLVKNNLTAIPSLHIDIVKDIRFSRRTTNDKIQALVLDFSNSATANEVIDQGLQWGGRRYNCEVFDRSFLDRCGHCQAYGHMEDVCSDPPRCGKCTERHRTKTCKSSSLTCTLCDGPHRPGSRRCQARGVRLLDKHNARFPLDPTGLSYALPSKEPKSTNFLLRSPATQVPASQIEHVDTMKELQPNLDLPKAGQTVFSYALPPAAQQLQDRLPALEAALESLCIDHNERRELKGFSKDELPTIFAQPALPLEEEEEIL